MVEEEPSVEELKRLLRRLEKIEALSEPARSRDAPQAERPSGEGLASLRTPLPPASFSFPELPPAFSVPPPAAERSPEFPPVALANSDLVASHLARPTPVGPPVQVPAPRSGVGTLLIAVLLGGLLSGGIAFAVMQGFIELPVTRPPLVTTVPSPEPRDPAGFARPGSAGSGFPGAVPSESKMQVEAPPSPTPDAATATARSGIADEQLPIAGLSPAPGLTADPRPDKTTPPALETVVAPVEIATGPVSPPPTADALAARQVDLAALDKAAMPELVLPIEAPPLVVIPSAAEPGGVRLATADTWTIPPGIRVALPLSIEPAGSVDGHYVLIVGLEPEASITRAVEILTGTWMIRGPDLAGAEIERAAKPPARVAAEIELRTLDGGIVTRHGFTLLTARANATPTPAAGNAPPVRTERSDASEAQRLLRRGQMMLESGNIGGARLLLQRAAELGNGEAALSLGRTYDPAAVSLFGAAELSADRALARRWYERAVRLGRSDAQERLDILDNN